MIQPSLFLASHEENRVCLVFSDTAFLEDYWRQVIE